jgi:hypothetical protein
MSSTALVIQTYCGSPLWPRVDIGAGPSGPKGEEWSRRRRTWSNQHLRNWGVFEWRSDAYAAFAFAIGRGDKNLNHSPFEELLNEDFDSVFVLTHSLDLTGEAETLLTSRGFSLLRFSHDSAVATAPLTRFMNGPSTETFSAVLSTFGPPEGVLALSIVLQSFLLCHESEWSPAVRSLCERVGLGGGDLAVRYVAAPSLDAGWWTRALGLDDRSPLLDSIRNYAGKEMCERVRTFLEYVIGSTAVDIEDAAILLRDMLAIRDAVVS